MAAKVDKQFKELQKWDGKGNPTPSTIPSSIVKGVQAKWNEEAGGWNIQQKSANKWEDISFIKDPTNYKTLALELGYDFEEKGIPQNESVIFTDNIQPRNYDQYKQKK